MDAFGDFKALQDSISSSLVAATRTASQIAAEDLAFHKTLNPSTAKVLDRQNARLLALTERLLGNAASNTEVVGPRLSDVEAVEANWRGIVDVVDSLLEKADISLDEYTGAVKRLSPGREAQAPTRSPRPSRTATALRSQDLPKPQLLFHHVPTNAETEPFKPLLTSKPHAAVSLKKGLRLGPDDQGHQQYSHPYQREIEQYEFPSRVYTEAEPIPYQPYESSTATLVDTEEALEQMLEELKSAKEIAVDLEHHDMRSYIGIVSLMQISTRNKDWIVDTLKPWRRKLSCLNDVFADPNILKVLHGAYMDIMWLQRDLGLYVVGLFDTHYAARAMGYAGGSLAFLLKKFIDFDAQKQYQTADWRVRPLPTELFDYARSDTHFLLYIYDNMRNELIQKSDFAAPNHEKDKLNDVLVRSKETALQTYRHPIYDSERGLGPVGWYKLLNRTPALLSKQQFAVFRAVHQWRDQVARQQDDSVHYILANHNIFTIAKEMPTEKVALFSFAQPLTQTVRLRSDELLAVILRAKETGGNGPDMMEMLKEINIHLHGEREPYVQAPAPVQPRVASPEASAITSTAKPQTANTTNTTGLRSTTSHFWGSAYESSAWRQQRGFTSEAMQLSVPLPALTAGVFVETSEAVTKTPTALNGAVPMDATPSKAPSRAENEDVFTLKQLGRKRKSDQISQSQPQSHESDGLATQADEVGLADTVAQQRVAEKAARKAARKAEKRAQKLGGHGQDDVDVDGLDEAAAAAVDEEPFDYAAAPSVLHAAREQARQEQLQGRRGKGKDKGGPKPFNPYAKAMDAPKGLARNQKERAGRSMTFKS